MDKVGRNDPCPCGSGKKHKKCCIDFTPRPYERASHAAPHVPHQEPIRTWMDDEGLHITAPEGVLTDQDMIEIQEGFKKKFRTSPEFKKLVDELGEAEAEKLLAQIEMKEK